MSDIYYVSPSCIPSTAANTVHVIMQVSALAECEVKAVTLFCSRMVLRSDEVVTHVKENYEVEHANFKVNSIPIFTHRGSTLLIALNAVFRLISKPRRSKVISRNLYFSFFWSVIFRRKSVYETHLVEKKLAGILQRWVISCPHTNTVVISEALKQLLQKNHKADLSGMMVLHDAASENIPSETEAHNGTILSEKIKSARYKSLVGYFGHLYPGRGIEIIIGLAKINPSVLFCVCGGTPDLVASFRSNNRLQNIIFLGHVPHRESRYLMSRCDVLLMPYQRKVSIGDHSADTSRWMSPMKMFEYMAAKKPFISSDLDVLREVLTDEVNALLVDPENVKAWDKALKRLISNKVESRRLASRAFNDFRKFYTWRARAKALIGLL